MRGGMVHGVDILALLWTATCVLSQSQRSITQNDNCKSAPCGDNGSCADNEGKNGYTCTCAAGYKGVNCEEGVLRSKEKNGESPVFLTLYITLGTVGLAGLVGSVYFYAKYKKRRQLADMAFKAHAQRTSKFTPDAQDDDIYTEEAMTQAFVGFEYSRPVDREEPTAVCATDLQNRQESSC